MSNGSLSLVPLRRFALPVAWLFIVLLLVVFAERRVAELDFNDDDGVLALQNEEQVEGDELLNKLLLVNDVTLPVVSSAPLPREEQPPLLTVVSRSLRVERGLKSRAPPSLLPAA